MSLIFKDRVKETTSTTGTGDIVLAGAADGYQAFSAIGDGNTTYYCIVSGNDWEVGVGTYTLATTTLSRDTILDSSTGSAISLSGTSTVFCTYAASKSVALELSNKISQAYTDYDPTIIISPGSSTRNQITPTGDYIPLALSLTSGHTTNALVVKNSSDVVVMSIGPTGTIKTFDSGGTKGVSISHDGTNGVVSTSSGKLKHVLPSARYLDIDDHWFGTGVHINAVDPASVGNTALYLGNDYNGSHLSVKCTASNVLVGTENNTSLYSLEGGWCGASTTCLRWTASTSGASTPDTGLSRNAAGVIQVNSGTAGALRDLTCRSLLPVAQTATDVPLTITLAAAQSANALNITSSGGSAGDLLNIGPAGRINIGGTTASSLGRQLNIHATTPGVVLYETDGGTDAKGWDFVIASEVFTFRCFNDAINSASNIFTVSRSSYIPNHMRIYPALELSTFHYNTYTNNGNSGSAKTVDWSVTQVQRVTLTDNCAFTFTGPNGISDVLLHVTQDGTGGFAATWPASVKWAGGTAPTLTTTAGAVSVLRFFYDGTSYWGSYELDVR